MNSLLAFKNKLHIDFIKSIALFNILIFSAFVLTRNQTKKSFILF